MQGKIDIEIGPYWMKTPVVTLEYLQHAKEFIDMIIIEIKESASLDNKESDKP